MSGSASQDTTNVTAGSVSNKPESVMVRLEIAMTGAMNYTATPGPALKTPGNAGNNSSAYKSTLCVIRRLKVSVEIALMEQMKVQNCVLTGRARMISGDARIIQSVLGSVVNPCPAFPRDNVSAF